MSILALPGGWGPPCAPHFPFSVSLTLTPSTAPLLATPAALSRALDRVRREFEFNISAVHHFDISLNSSKTLADVALDIMEGVSQRLEPTRQVMGLFACASSCAILYLYLK